jgi:hypothetical protein
VRQRPEQRFIQKLIAQSAVKALDKRILGWLSGLDIMPGDATGFGPAKDGVRGQLSSVVADDGGGFAAPGHDAIKFAGDATPADRGVCDQPKALARAIIDHGQNAKAAAVSELIMNKIKAPACVGRKCRSDWRTDPKGAFAAFAPPDAEFFFTVDPEDAFVVRAHALAPK